jgi:hypothetical protein
MKEAASSIHKQLSSIIDADSRNILNESFISLRSANTKTYKVSNLSIEEPMPLNNSTDYAGESAIDGGHGISPYYNPETPSSNLIGQSLAFDQSFI